MGRSPCCDENGLKKGPWTPEEDQKLIHYIEQHGHGSWRALPKLAGLNRCGKSCRLRWTNYLRPDIKRGKFSQEEEQTILNLHSILGNKWSAIATHLPGRTDNEIKNFWNTHLKKKLIQMGFDPMTHRPRTDLFSSLPQLIALANLNKELMMMDHHNHQQWEDHAAVRLQAEAVQLAKLQYLQYIFQTTSTNTTSTPPLLNPLNITNNNISDIEAFNNLLINNPSLLSSSSPPPPPLNRENSNLSTGTTNFSHLESPTSCATNVNNTHGTSTPMIVVPPTLTKCLSSSDMSQVCNDFQVFGTQGGLDQMSNGNKSEWISPILMSDDQSLCASAAPAVVLTITNETSMSCNTTGGGDACSSSSSYGGIWPELLLEDPFNINEIA
ncbi:hypothetical protein Syun_013597 [Stephania yunnanensis]|uniref:Uncharacterized protein n=1 Tax=Stephania yunnanensis TaxID=152371 RepID=A0AAP0JJY4_9MAGN